MNSSYPYEVTAPSVTRSMNTVTDPYTKLFRSYPVRMVLLLLLHVPLALAMQMSPAVATIHALVVFAIGGILLLKKNNAYAVICVVAYVIGAEILWRMTHANIFWESGKYGATMLMMLYILRQGKWIRISFLPLLYFSLLLPSVFLVLDDFDGISFNMSGPLLLATSVIFFSKICLTQEQMRRVLVALLIPILAAAFLAVDSTITYEGPLGAYTKVTSGGIGQNQMATALGLGMLVAAIYTITGKRYRWFRVFIALCGIGLATQCLLTMSRGGLLTGVGAILMAAFYLIRNKRLFVSIVLGGVLLYVMSVQVLIPFVDDLTGGAMSNRYEKAAEGDTSGRWDIFLTDLQIFEDNTYMGVGPGGSRLYRIFVMNMTNSPHTEFSRLLAEHGLFGLFALLTFLFMTIRRALEFRPAFHKAFYVAFLAWSVATMLHAAMRLAAPGFMFGLAFVTMVASRPPKAKNGSGSSVEILPVVGDVNGSMGPVLTQPVPRR